MKKNSILQSMLTHLAEDAALPGEIDLWPTIQARLAAGKTISQIREPEMNTKHGKIMSYRLAAVGVLTLLLAFGIYLVVPQGRVWAQNILRFFTPTIDQKPLPTSQPIKINLVNLTPGPVHPAMTPTAAWHPAFYSTCGDLAAPRCSIEQIQKMVDFPVKGIADLPQGMQFLGATGGPDGIFLVYWRNNPTSSVLLIEGPVTKEEKPLPVGSSAVIETVQVGSASGEYVKGSYNSNGGDTVAKWDPNSDIQSLRWEDQGVLYTLSVSGSTDFPQYALDKNGMIRMAISLTGERTKLAAQPTVEVPKTAAEVQEQAGFQVIEPAWLPEGYRFERAIYLPGRRMVCLEYRHPSDISMFRPSNAPATTLSLVESISTPLPDPKDLVVTDLGLKPDQLLLEKESLRVGGALNETGQYTWGSIDASKICGSRLQHHMLEVETGKLSFAIFAQMEGPINSMRNWLTKQELVKLAESITGVRTIAEDQLDPDYLTSLEDAKKLTGFPLKFPTLLPEGMHFTYAKVMKDGNQQTTVLNFGDGSVVISVNEIQGSQDTLESISKHDPKAYRRVTIHSQPALISQGLWNLGEWKEMANGGDGGASVTWFENGIEYVVGGFNAYPSQVWLEIAEGVK